jgi:hypothetical protein
LVWVVVGWVIDGVLKVQVSQVELEHLKVQKD